MRLILCDANRIWCEALAATLQARGHRVLAIATSAAGSVAAVAANCPDACLLDLRFPDGSGLDAARVIRRRYPATKVVVLSCVTDPAAVSEVKRIGAAGFIGKDQKPVTITDALEVIGAGRVAFDIRPPCQPGWRAVPPPREGVLHGLTPGERLTPRERQVLRRIVAGQSTGQMAREMNVATTTLRSHIERVLIKLGAHSRVQAAAIASRGPSMASGA